MKNTMHIPQPLKTSSVTLALAMISCFGFTTIATAQTVAAPAKVQTVINQGNVKIDVRLKKLTQLQTQVNAMSKLSEANKQELRSELTKNITDLNAQRTKIDADTTLAAAKADYANIFANFRIYALVVPKIAILQVADDQLNKDDAGMVYASLLKVIVAQSPQTVKYVPTADDMIAKITAAKKQSQAVHDQVLALQPKDYNADHALLKGKLATLKQAAVTYKAAIAEGDKVVKQLQQQ